MPPVHLFAKTWKPRSHMQSWKQKHPNKVFKECSEHGCTNRVNAKGVCSTHGRKQCEVDGCTTKAGKQWWCRIRGWWWYINIKYINCCLLIWNICDTITIIVARGVCAKHGAKDACSVPGCSTNSQSKGLCGKHGANGSCTFPGCEVRNIYTTEYIYR